MNPTELLASDITLPFDLETELGTVELNPTRSLKMKEFRVNETSIVAVLKGKLFQDKINVQDFDGRKAYSLGMNFSDGDHQILFDQLSSLIKDVVTDEWSVNNPAKADSGFWVRLATDYKTGAIKTKSNISLKPSSIQKVKIQADQDIEVTAELKAWFDFKMKKSGVSLKVTFIKFM